MAFETHLSLSQTSALRHQVNLESQHKFRFEWAFVGDGAT